MKFSQFILRILILQMKWTRILIIFGVWQLAVIFGLESSQMYGQDFLNGSFEQTNIECRFGLSSGGFTSHVDHTISFGWLQVIHFLSESCTTLPAQDGDYYLGLNIEGDRLKPSVVGLELSSPLIEGNSYTISFDHRSGSKLAHMNELQIGLSDSSMLFGPVIYELDGTNDGWYKETFQFVAPITGKYITMKLRYGIPATFHLDNFSLACPEEVGLGADTVVCQVDKLLIKPEGWFESYQWQDLSSDPFFIVEQPGDYSVEVTRGSCVLRDTIRVSEYPFNCECPVYMATAFSPNRDGHNDVIAPVIPCELADYEFVVFDRWGRKIFVSQNPDDPWGGEGLPAGVQSGAYVYLLTYRFPYQEMPSQKWGSIMLIK